MEKKGKEVGGKLDQSEVNGMQEVEMNGQER